MKNRLTDLMVERIAYILRDVPWICLKQVSYKEYRPREQKAVATMSRTEDECLVCLRQGWATPALFDEFRMAGFVVKNDKIMQVADNDGIYYEFTLVRETQQ